MQRVTYLGALVSYVLKVSVPVSTTAGIVRIAAIRGMLVLARFAEEYQYEHHFSLVPHSVAQRTPSFFTTSNTFGPISHMSYINGMHPCVFGSRIIKCSLLHVSVQESRPTSERRYLTGLHGFLSNHMCVVWYAFPSSREELSGRSCCCPTPRPALPRSAVRAKQNRL